MIWLCKVLQHRKKQKPTQLQRNSDGSAPAVRVHPNGSCAVEQLLDFLRGHTIGQHFVDLQLHAHVQGTTAIENGVGLVRVVVDGVPAPVPTVAVVAQHTVVILVVSIFLADDAVALVAGVV